MIGIQLPINACVESSGKKIEALISEFRQQLSRSTKQSMARFSPDFIKRYATFIFSPQSFSISYAPKQTKEWGDLSNLSLSDLSKDNGFNLLFNQQPVDKIVRQVNLNQILNKPGESTGVQHTFHQLFTYFTPSVTRLRW